MQAVRRSGDKVTVMVDSTISTEAARDLASSEVGLRRDAVRFVARQRLSDGTIVYTFRLPKATVPPAS